MSSRLRPAGGRLHTYLWMWMVICLVVGIPLILVGFDHSERIGGTALAGYIEDGAYFVQAGGDTYEEVSRTAWWIDAALYALGFGASIAGLLLLFIAFSIDIVLPISRAWLPEDTDRRLK